MLLYIVCLIAFALTQIVQSNGADRFPVTTDWGEDVSDDLSLFYQYKYKYSTPVLEDDGSLSVSRLSSGPPIPLWPNNKPVPGERPGVIGNETIHCSNKDTPIPQCQNRAIFNATIPTLIPFLVPSSDAAVIVAPGGGYGLLAFDTEGTDICRWLNSIGISAFVLKYRVPGRPWLPFGAAPLMDAQRAMGLVRQMAAHGTNPQIPNLDASKIGFMGFSAGGHLTGHLNVAWLNRTYDPPLDSADQLSCRPDFSIMVYPWRSVSQPPVNEPISGASALNVTNTTPPTMLIQTQDDPVHVENAIYYYLALKQHDVSPSELHVYPRGGHGYGRCTLKTTTTTTTTTTSNNNNLLEVCSWTDRAHDFFKALGVVVSAVVEKE